MATREKQEEKTGEQSQLDCIAAELRLLKDRVERMQENWLRYWKVAIGPGAYPKNKPGQVGATRIRHVLALLAVSAGVAVLAWATGEKANWTSGSGATRIDQASQTAPQILIADSLRVGIITNTGALVQNGNVTLGDTPASDTHTINGSTTIKGDVTLIDTTQEFTNSIESDAVGTVTIGRPTAGTVTITVKDNNSTADVVLSAGGNGSVTLGDNAVQDTVVLYGPVTMYDVTLLATNAASTNTIKSTAVGTVEFGRPTAGTVTLTSADNNSDAALTIAAGGSGALTVGDTGSATTITGSSVDLLKGATIGSLAAAVGPGSTAPLIQYYTIVADASHTVLTQALTTAYGNAVAPSVVALGSAVDAALCASTVASNSFQLTITAGTATYYTIVAGPRP